MEQLVKATLSTFITLRPYQHYQRAITNNMGIKIHSRLPPFIKNSAGNSKTFTTLLKKFLYSYSFYTLDEYLNLSSTQILVQSTYTVAVTKMESSNIHILSILNDFHFIFCQTPLYLAIDTVYMYIFYCIFYYVFWTISISFGV